ncbi:DUF2218 domain-containing protein [Consotaella salsifontis]|uniref:DUF2218 domain-containing protein n=1 Tax=Consotaella salsifontis TaxID=1365950 RepID=A0A1T4RY63_9HYPH|nr:DUF2218 domain-containing protein [Consotaella salsifontis]SKA20939.1 hypothetical protein SAMN05428963_10881 [Consotaella salsifontis]
MPTGYSEVKTDHASRYLQQLCKHWSHKLDVAFDETKGSIVFQDGTKAELAAREGELLMEVSAGDEETLARVEKVVADHLVRFAFRETLDIVWQTR